MTTLFFLNALILAQKVKPDSEFNNSIALIALLSHSSSILAAAIFLLGIPFLPALIHITASIAILYVWIRTLLHSTVRIAILYALIRYKRTP